MAGIYIPGMEMPYDENDSIHILRDGTVVVYRTGSIDFYRAVPVPDHGRLIDADVFAEILEKHKKEYALKAKEDIVHLHKAWGLSDAELMAESLPTIIPAEEGEG